MSKGFWTGEIAPASIQQVRAGRDGQMVQIDEDVAGVAEGLRRVDPALRLRYSEAGDYFVVYCREEHQPEGSGYLVATYQDCDQRIVKDIERIAWENRQPGYSLADEMDEAERQAEADFDGKMSEKIAAGAEELAFALREGLGKNNHRAFIGKGIG